MSWTFEIATGKLFDQGGNLVETGYSGGNCGQDLAGVNNPNMCNTPKVGPIPTGIYTRGTAVEHSQLGAFAIPLIPDPANEMYGRSGFYMHGDTQACNKSASEGCIIVGPVARHTFYSSTDDTIQVIPGVINND